MRSLPAGVLLFVLVARGARAEDAGVALEEAVRCLRSDDPAERDRGSAILDRLAAGSPRIAWPLLDHPDPEVSGRAFEALLRHEALPEAVVEERARQLLDAFSDTSIEDREARRRLVERLRELGAPAARLLKQELENTCAEPEITDLRVMGGTESIAYAPRIRNAGSVGLWISPSNLEAMDEDTIRMFRAHGLDPFDAPAPGRGAGVGAGNRGPAFPAAPAEVERTGGCEWLALARRLRPGQWCELPRGTFKLAAQRGTAGILELGHDGPRVVLPSRFVFGGVELGRNEEPVRLPLARYLVLQEIACQEFFGRIVRHGNRIGLEVTAREEIRSAHSDGRRDRYWFAAVGDGGEPLAYGPMRVSPVSDAPWHPGDRREIALEWSLPRGTRQVWLGFDWGADWGDTGQLVPAPLDLGPGRGTAAAQ